MSFKDVVLKSFSLSNCTTKAKCWVVKTPRNCGHPSTKGRIRMQYGERSKDSTESKQRQFPYVGGLQKNWHSHLSRPYPEALKNTYTHTHKMKHTTQPNKATGLQTGIGKGTLPPAAPDPHCLPSLPQGLCSRLHRCTV